MFEVTEKKGQDTLGKRDSVRGKRGKEAQF